MGAVGTGRGPSCEALDSPAPRSARRGCPRFRRRSRKACRPSPALAPPLFAANSRSATEERNGFILTIIYLGGKKEDLD